MDPGRAIAVLQDVNLYLIEHGTRGWNNARMEESARAILRGISKGLDSRETQKAQARQQLNEILVVLDEDEEERLKGEITEVMLKSRLIRKKAPEFGATQEAQDMRDGLFALGNKEFYEGEGL